MPETLAAKPPFLTPEEVNGVGESERTTIEKGANTKLDQLPPQIIFVTQPSTRLRPIQRWMLMRNWNIFLQL